MYNGFQRGARSEGHSAVIHTVNSVSGAERKGEGRTLKRSRTYGALTDYWLLLHEVSLTWSSNISGNNAGCLCFSVCNWDGVCVRDRKYFKSMCAHMYMLACVCVCACEYTCICMCKRAIFIFSQAAMHSWPAGNKMCDTGVTLTDFLQLSNVPVTPLIYCCMWFTWQACHLQSVCGIMIDQLSFLGYFSHRQEDGGGFITSRFTGIVQHFIHGELSDVLGTETHMQACMHALKHTHNLAEMV